MHMRGFYFTCSLITHVSTDVVCSPAQSPERDFPTTYTSTLLSPTRNTRPPVNCRSTACRNAVHCGPSSDASNSAKNSCRDVSRTARPLATTATA